MATDKGKFDQAEKAAELESRARQTRNPELELQRKQERKIKSATKNVAKMRERGDLPPSKKNQPTKTETSKAKKLLSITKKYEGKRPFLKILKKIPGVKKVAGLAEALIEYSANQPLTKTAHNYQMIARKADQVKISPTEMRQALEKSRLKKEIGTYLKNKKEGKSALSKKQVAEIEDQLGKFPEKGFTPYSHRNIKEGPLRGLAGKQKRLSRLEKELTGMSPGTFSEAAKGKESKRIQEILRKKKLTGKEGEYGYEAGAPKPKPTPLTKKDAKGKPRKETEKERKQKVQGMTVKQKLGRAAKLERADKLFARKDRVSSQDPIFDKSEEFFDVGTGTGTSSAVRSGKKSGAQIANEAKMKSLRVALNRLQKAKKEGKDFATINGKKVSVKAIGVTRDRITAQLKKLREREKKVPGIKNRKRPVKSTRTADLQKKIQKGRATSKPTLKNKSDAGKKYLTKEQRKVTVKDKKDKKKEIDVQVPLDKTKIFLRKGEGMLNKGGLVMADHYFKRKVGK